MALPPLSPRWRSWPAALFATPPSVSCIRLCVPPPRPPRRKHRERRQYRQHRDLRTKCFRQPHPVLHCLPCEFRAVGWYQYVPVHQLSPPWLLHLLHGHEETTRTLYRHAGRSRILHRRGARQRVFRAPPSLVLAIVRASPALPSPPPPFSSSPFEPRHPPPEGQT